MANPAQKVKVDLMASLLDLPTYVVQNFFFNVATDNHQYALQYPEPTVTIYKSLKRDDWDWQYYHGDNRPISFSKQITLDLPLSAHTQTLLQDGGTVITGMYDIGFNNLTSLLDNATDAQKSRFYKDNQNTVSWQLFENHKKFETSNLSQNGDSTKWCTYFIGMNNKIITQNPYDGQYVNIIGTDKTFNGKSVKRNELAIDAHNNRLLLAQNDFDNNLYLSVYRIDILDRVGNKLAGLGSILSAYWDKPEFPTKDNVGVLKMDDVLSFYKDALNANAFVFDLSKEIPDKSFCYQLDDLLSLTGMSGTKFSYQGFGVDYDENIYLASGFAPKSTSHPNPHIFKIDKNDWYSCTDINCYQYFTDQSSSTSDLVFPEIENIEVLATNCVLVSVAKHNASTGRTFANNVYRVTWS